MVPRFVSVLRLLTIALAFFLSGYAKASTCTPEALRKRCERIWPDLEADIVEAYNRADHVGEEQVQKIREVGTQIKKDVVANLRRGRTFSELSLAEQAFERKIESVKFLSPNHTRVAENPFCLGRRANAFYEPPSHAIIVCPALAFESRAAMTQILGHEILHALDPCILKNDIYKVNAAMLVQKRKQLGAFSPFKKSELDEMISAAKASGRVSLKPDVARDASSLFPPGSLTKEASGADMAEYPFQKAYTCFASAPFSFPTGEGTNPTTSQSFAEASRGKNECDLKNQMGEVMSDWMGAKLLGQELDRHPPSGDRQLFAALSIYYPQICPMPAPQQSLLTKGISKLMKAMGRTSSDNHPSQEDRLTKVFMTEPSIRRAFGCEQTVKTCFDSEPKSSSTTGRARASGGATRP